MICPEFVCVVRYIRLYALRQEINPVLVPESIFFPDLFCIYPPYDFCIRML